MKPRYHLFVTEYTNTSSPASAGGLYQDFYVAASSTDTYYSRKMQVSEEGLVGFTLETTGNLTGVFTLWYSDEDRPSLSDDTDWVQDTSWVPTNPAAGTTKVKYVIADLKCRWVRVKYVNASGTGNLIGHATY